MDQYLPILLLIVLVLAFAIGSFMASKMLGPNGHLDPAKRGPYESGDRACMADAAALSCPGSTWSP